MSASTTPVPSPRDTEPILTPPLRQALLGLMSRYPTKQAVTLPALHLVQQTYGCVSLQAVREIADLLELHPAEVHDTLSFYGFFRDEEHRLGRHRVWVCRSLSCALRGGETLLAQLSQYLGIHPGETTPDGRITLEFAECLGACEGAPCMLINDDRCTNLTMERAVAKLDALP
ncbi:MAG: hypothetical protein KatS3mg114_0052 [Planctomycetaceae bacterium]|nr:MAG: hypothetical protein KatS3mg114_0052 [Planctomycetaceae bacterium]